MKIKEFIRLFVPPIYYKINHRIQIKKEQPIHPLPKVEHEGHRMVIVGNGPSLSKTVELYEQQLLESDCMMVNFSARTSLFELIKPKYYVMADPNWIKSPDSIRENIILCVKDIVSKTRWPMSLLLPAQFRGWWAIDEFKKNSHITILFDESSWWKYEEPKLFEELDANRVSPPTNTVLSYCLYLSLYWGYEETYLVGADTTFTQMAYVGQKDNVLYTVDTHFYNNDEVCPTNFEPEKHGRPYGMDMEHYMEMCYTIFYEYNLLARYAKWKGLKVFNASEYSMIDTFERKKLV